MGVTAVDAEAIKATRSAAPARAPRAPDSGWLRELRHLPDSLMHSRRRVAAQVQLRNLRPRSILFMCHGNICRSPFAAAAFLEACSPSHCASIKVMSAGFIGPGRVPPGKALRAGWRHGVDLSSHRSALATVERLKTADLVVVMSAEQAQGVQAHVRADGKRVLVLGDLDPLPIQARTIADPWGNSDEAFDASYDRIQRCVRELARIVAATK